MSPYTRQIGAIIPGGGLDVEMARLEMAMKGYVTIKNGTFFEIHEVIRTIPDGRVKRYGYDWMGSMSIWTIPILQAEKTRIDQSTVSSGTLKREDLIPSFLDAFDSIKYEGIPSGVDPLEWQRFIENAESLIGNIEERMEESDDYWSSDDPIWDLDTLFHILEEAAAFQGRTFGAHPGDGALFGFWEGE